MVQVANPGADAGIDDDSSGARPRRHAAYQVGVFDDDGDNGRLWPPESSLAARIMA